MRRIALVLLLMLVLAAAGLAEAERITYRDYGGKLTVSADAEYIDLGKLKVERFDDFAAFLQKLPELKKVDMFTTHMFTKQARRLSEQFPQIEFGWTVHFGDHAVRTDQVVFSTLHDGVMRRHTSEQMEVLRYCRSLRALDLGHNELTDISFLADLSELRLLILADNEIEDLSPLAGLDKLEYLELFDNRVTSLEPLAGLKNLMDLNAAQNSVTDLAPLEDMPWLKRLWIRDCGNENAVNDTALEALRAALVNTQIDAASLGTEGGWRLHPHYDVLFQMFKGTQYIPFEDSYTEEKSL